MVTLVVLPAVRLLGEAETSSLPTAAAETEIGLLVPEIVADESVAVIVCVPDVCGVAATEAIPLVNVTAPKLAPPRLSESVTASLNPVATLLY